MILEIRDMRMRTTRNKIWKQIGAENLVYSELRKYIVVFVAMVSLKRKSSMGAVPNYKLCCILHIHLQEIPRKSTRLTIFVQNDWEYCNPVQKTQFWSLNKSTIHIMIIELWKPLLTFYTTYSATGCLTVLLVIASLSAISKARLWKSWTWPTLKQQPAGRLFF